MFHNFDIPKPQAESIKTLKEDEKIYTPAITPEELIEVCKGNELLQEVLEDMFKHCLRYAETVAEFKKVIMDEDGMGDALAQIDTIRGTSHDATIDSINSFSRLLAKNGKNNDWVREVSQNRASYGKFAILTALQLV